MKNSAKFGIFILTATVATLTFSCDPAKKYEKEEQAKIDTYLSENTDLTFVRKSSGMYYYEEVTGTGLQAVKNDTAYVFYTGKFLNGNKFDSNVGTKDTLIFLVGNGYLIPGFDEGITYMKGSGKARFIVPSYLGYGNAGYYMPAFTPLLFEVSLVKLKKPAK